MMQYIEILGVITTLWCVWLTRNQKILSWPIGIVACVAYFILFKDSKLYSDMTLQIFFLLQSVYGWYNWSKEHKELPVAEFTNARFISGITLTVLGSICLGYILGRFTDSQQPFLDALAASLSLLANWYLTRKIIQSWYLWIAVDAMLTGLFLYKGLFWSAGLYFVLFLLAINAYNKWRRELTIAI